MCSVASTDSVPQFLGVSIILSTSYMYIYKLICYCLFIVVELHWWRESHAVWCRMPVSILHTDYKELQHKRCVPHHMLLFIVWFSYIIMWPLAKFYHSLSRWFHTKSDLWDMLINIIFQGWPSTFWWMTYFVRGIFIENSELHKKTS
jgi:hypothetical protein